MVVTDRPEWITPDIARPAVIRHGRRTSWLLILKGLMSEYGKSLREFDYRAACPIINSLLDEYWGIYLYAGPRGGISRRYTGIEAAQAAARRYSPKAALVMLHSGHAPTPFAKEVARYMRALPDQPDMVERLYQMLRADRPSKFDCHDLIFRDAAAIVAAAA
jgi:hypothetical protein